MTGRFSADWLDLREPYDHVARQATGAPRPRPADETITVVDLACGTGANLRHLAPRLGGRQRWRLLDFDDSLLAQVPARLSEWADRQHWRCVRDGPLVRIDGEGFSAEAVGVRADLAGDDLDAAVSGSDLVTTSALLDLVSTRWLGSLIDACTRAQVPVHWALSYDGTIEWSPQDRFDGLVTEAVNRHQGRDKGFGPALGPAAARTARTLLETAGFVVATQRSDWLVATTADAPVSTRAMQAALIDGWATAAAETEPTWRARIAGWLARRHRQMQEGDCVLRVGHQDIVAQPRRRA